MKKKFTIECEMEERWVPHFLGMLERMRYLGSIGSSRGVTLYSDGDGDYHPKFTWDSTLPKPAEPKSENFYDAG